MHYRTKQDISNAFINKSIIGNAIIPVIKYLDLGKNSEKGGKEMSGMTEYAKRHILFFYKIIILIPTTIFSIYLILLLNYQNQYFVLLHALKSASRLIGAEKLATLAERLEEAGNEGNIELIHEKTEKMLSMYILFFHFFLCKHMYFFLRQPLFYF